MSDGLEQRYRHAMRWYPRRWRARHGSALLGILLDRAEEEGRTRMSSAEQHDLARHGLRRRLAPFLLGALLVLGVLAAAQIVSMLSFGNRLEDELFIAPSWPVPGIGGSSTSLFFIDFQAGALYLVCTLVVFGAVAGSALVVQRMRRA